MTMTIEDTIQESVEAVAPPVPSERMPAEATPRTPTLTDLVAAAENEIEDATAKAHEELAAIVGRADHPYHGDGQRFLQLVDELRIPRKVARRAVEAVAGWNRQRDRLQADVATLETRQAELTQAVAQLEAKGVALTIDPSHEALVNLASAFVAVLHARRTPAISAAFLRFQGGWKGDQHGWDRGNDRCLPLENALRRTFWGLLQSDVAKDLLAQMCATNLRCGGMNLTRETSGLVEANI
jgi:hypothetical protein